MQPNLTEEELKCLAAYLDGWADTADALRMRQYIQHGCVTTYEHCMRVAAISFWLNRRLNLGCDEASLVRGAFLHDFYLYDWHEPHPEAGLHGFSHPAIALANAEQRYTLNDRERNVIRSHMWPLTLLTPPRCREAAVVCVADKMSSATETLFERQRMIPAAQTSGRN
ncbi:MAG TPA: HD domain-containing protein [Candidatus Gemmiger faecavium]|nr:HD domain-containing protein [Candidatus Gemmiger faecavium]